MKKLLFSLLISLSVVSFAQAQVYRWVDEDGITHFSDQAPGGKKADKVDIRQSGSPGSSSSRHNYDPQRLRENEQRFLQAVEAERRLKEARKAEMAQKKAEQEVYCKNLHNRLLNFREGFSMVRRNAEGAIEHIPDAEVAARHEQLEQLWREKCANVTSGS